jgi:hypothetical protein
MRAPFLSAAGGQKTGLSGAALSLRPPLRGGRYAPLQSLAQDKKFIDKGSRNS